MHVALFSPAWPLERYHNGIVTYVHWMRRELERLGHRVSVFTGVGEAAADDPHVHLVRLGLLGRIRRRLRQRGIPADAEVFEWGRVIASSVLAVHRRQPIDVIEMEESFGWFGDVGRMTGIPVLVKLHGPAFLSLVDEELATPKGTERVRREGVALAEASAIAAPAATTLAHTTVHYRLDPAIRAHVVNPLTLAADTPRWRLDACEPQTLLFVGRFDRRKGGDLVLQAFALLLRERPTLKLVFVGPDEGLIQPDGSRVHFATFRDRTLTPVQALQVDNRGRLPNAEIAALRTRAMVTVIASRWENQGYTALEAMAQGCPVVATAVGGNPESVIHEQTGLLARPEDPVDLAVQIAAILERPDAAARLGAAAHRHVIEHHSSGKVAKESLALYERVIAHRRSR